MGRIREAFADGKAFIPFVTAGYPDLETTKSVVKAAQENGADLIEIGIPFSDPTAEGPVIQTANVIALEGGVTTDMILEFVKELREKDGITVPLVFMTYAIREACQAAGIDLISLIAPTSEARISRIAEDAEGFLYVVSSLGVTGERSQITTDIGAITQKIRAVTDIPCAVGFGISTPQQAAKMAEQSDGAIVGSAIIRIITEYGTEAAPEVGKYVKRMKDAMRKCSLSHQAQGNKRYTLT